MRYPGTPAFFGIRVALIALAIFMCNSSISAQGAPSIIEAVASNKPSYIPPGWRIFVTFSEPFTAADEANVEAEANFSLYHAQNGALVPILESKIASTRSGTKIYSMVELRVGPLTAGDFYQLFAARLTFDQKALEEPIAGRVEFSSNTSGDDAAASLPLTAADDREDANIYIAGEITRASGSDFNGSADLRLSYPIPADFWGRSHFFEPLFDLKANSDAEADPDTMEFGLDWDFLLLKRRGSPNFFKPIRWKNSFLVEAERDFDNANLTWGSRFVFPSRVLQTENRMARFYLRPFVGIELGKNLNSPVEEAEHRGIARGVFGSTLHLGFPLNQKSLSSIVLEGSFQRRLLMLREIYFEKAEDDELRPVFFARNPRDWIDAKLTFNITDSFGTYIGYEYGQEPPSYKLVDHRVKIGLVYKVKFKKPEE